MFRKESKVIQTWSCKWFSKIVHNSGCFGSGFLIFEDCVLVPSSILHDVFHSEKTKKDCIRPEYSQKKKLRIATVN